MPVDPNHAQIELKLPCLNKTRITISSSESTPDTEKFLTSTKFKNGVNKLLNKTILGVLDGSYEVGNYAAKIINDDDGRRVVLIPVDSTVQLKTFIQVH